MDENNRMAFMDEEGNKVELEVIAKIYLNDNEYAVLAPIDEKSEDAFIFRIDEEDGNPVYNLVENDEEFLEVKKEYKKLLYSEK